MSITDIQRTQGLFGGTSLSLPKGWAVVVMFGATAHCDSAHGVFTSMAEALSGAVSRAHQIGGTWQIVTDESWQSVFRNESHDHVWIFRAPLVNR
mgnify:CR=1 FL=1